MTVHWPLILPFCFPCLMLIALQAKCIWLNTMLVLGPVLGHQCQQGCLHAASKSSPLHPGWNSCLSLVFVPMPEQRSSPFWHVMCVLVRPPLHSFPFLSFHAAFRCRPMRACLHLQYLCMRHDLTAFPVTSWFHFTQTRKMLCWLGRALLGLGGRYEVQRVVSHGRCKSFT